MLLSLSYIKETTLCRKRRESNDESSIFGNMVHPEPDRIQTGIANDAPVNRLLLPSASLLDTQFTRAPLDFRFVRVYPFPFSVPVLPSLLEGFRSRSDKSLFL
ncbi:hypothetical protein CPSG_07121 [Coccidioides posadasii str. Silveira]|uniref:Uncharacterized protein n=1 Tax=Coccidioides posadasii (strain RMSCC 757 / Silveira) TaxID=443226 RepID=E9DBB9_COCPS|nr:hypothetical protein CPSG_07121 [Coccidioides posadasii str. Silveira]